MKTRDELNTDIQLEILAELQKSNVSPVIDHHQLKRDAYQRLLKPKPFSTFGNSSVE
jgi:hypothetical protein